MEYKQPDTIGRLSIPVLEFLNGLKWAATTKNMLAALRPSAIRESWGSIKLDGQCWRVTVYLKGDEKAPVIDYIQQEVQVGLEGFDHGFALQQQLEKEGMKEFL
jgi:hypothetical protein